MEHSAKTPVLFWAIAIIALLWNLMGVGAYLFEAFSDADALRAAYSDVEAQAVLNRPAWVTAIFAIAVFSGVVGCIGLLLRKKWALSAFLISLAAVIIQQIYIFGMTDAAAHLSGASWIMPVSIPIVSLFLVWFARKKTLSGLLT